MPPFLSLNSEQPQRLSLAINDSILISAGDFLDPFRYESESINSNIHWIGPRTKMKKSLPSHSPTRGYCFRITWSKKQERPSRVWKKSAMFWIRIFFLEKSGLFWFQTNQATHLAAHLCTSFYVEARKARFFYGKYHSSKYYIFSISGWRLSRFEFYIHGIFCPKFIRNNDFFGRTKAD